MLVSRELLELIRQHLEVFLWEAAKDCIMKADKTIEMKTQCETH